MIYAILRCFQYKICHICKIAILLHPVFFPLCWAGSSVCQLSLIRGLPKWRETEVESFEEKDNHERSWKKEARGTFEGEKAENTLDEKDGEFCSSFTGRVGYNYTLVEVAFLIHKLLQRIRRRMASRVALVEQSSEGGGEPHEEESEEGDEKLEGEWTSSEKKTVLKEHVMQAESSK